MSPSWTENLPVRRRLLSWARGLGVGATVTLAASAAFTIVTPDEPPEFEWKGTDKDCGELGDIDEACLKRGPWLKALPRVEAVRRARLYHHLGATTPSPQDAIDVSLKELDSYCADDAQRQLAADLAVDGWVYAPDDAVADEIVQAVAAGGPQVEQAQRSTEQDVQRYEAIVQRVFAEAKAGLVVIEEGNLKAWERRTSATRAWMSLARPALGLGVLLALGALLALVLAALRGSSPEQS